MVISNSSFFIRESKDVIMENNGEDSGKNLAISARLGKYQPAIDAAWMELKKDRIIERIWSHDHTVWQPDPVEISNRLGWLDIAERMRSAIPELTDLTNDLRKAGFKQAVLLGMGGSSLAPEVFRKTFGQKEGYLDLIVLDSTDPAALISLGKSINLAHTLFIISTKSGGTTETLSFFKHFYNRMSDAVGKEKAGGHFIAITDPNSTLVELANRYLFRATFLNDANIGGRYSALSYFGLLPAALVGVDLAKLLERAINIADECKDKDGPGGWLGVILGELAKAGRDKVTFILSTQINGFGDWVEQLIAESTGKSGKGILPVVGEPLGPASVYGSDRLFVNLNLGDNNSNGANLQKLVEAGHPVLTLQLQDVYDLGRQFFLWEFATAVAGYRMGIQPFDQPNVEAAKILARNLVTDFAKKGALPAALSAEMTSAALQTFLGSAEPGAYIAIQAYVQPSAAMDEALLGFRLKLRARTQLATTVGYGPRFLHSTGQLHKGDAGKGLFIQFISHAVQDVIIPNEAGQSGGGLTFGTLKAAQALGDQQALLEAGRKVIHFNLGSVELARKLEQFTNQF
jgi:transaldolase/glucose-6-phosphate isomerase